jgi:predicted permease
MRLEHWLYTVPLRWRSLFRRRQMDQELDEELLNHLEQRIQDYVDAGLTPEEARYAALREWRGTEQIKEDCRDMRRVNFMHDLASDIRYALRQLRRSPGFAAVVVLSLALGIGANTAIFSLMDAVLWEMLPVKQPRQLVLLNWSSKGWPDVIDSLEGGDYLDELTGMYRSQSFSYPSFERLRDGNHVFSQTFAYAANSVGVNVSMNGRAESIRAYMISGTYFEGLGVRAIAGRTILPSDDAPSAPPVVVLSYRFWQRRFGEDVSMAGKVVGKVMAVNGIPVTVVGVTPPEFFGLAPGQSPDLFVPLGQYTHLLPAYEAAAMAGTPPVSMMQDSRRWWLVVVGRLRPDVTEARARAELKVIFDQSLPSSEKAHDPKRPVLGTASASKGLDGLRTQFSQALWVMMGMVALVLSIACANAAGLLLARATAREKEIAVRLSLGARRSRLIRQLLTESLLLSVAAGAAGLLFSRWAGWVLLAWLSEGNSPLTISLHVDMRILVFTVLVSLGTGIIFGLAPALQSTRSDLGATLKRGAKKIRRAGRYVSGRILVAGQVALCLLLLVSAGLFLRTLANLKNLDVGFRRDHLLQFSIRPGLNGYRDARLGGFYQELQRRIQLISGVRSVGLSGHGIVGAGVSISQAAIPGYTEGKPRVSVYRNFVGPGFFSTMGIPLVLGRVIDARDGPDSLKAAVVNERLVKDYFHGDNPIGRSLEFGTEKKPRTKVIVGVVGNAKFNRLRDEDPPTAYFAYQQDETIPTSMTFEVRTAADSKGLIATISREALALDKDVPITNVKTLTEAIAQDLTQERMFARLASVFGVLALALACIGLYGTMAYAVARRTSEIGIRMAVGAGPANILGMVLRDSAVLVLAGSVLGLAAALAATRVIRSQLYGLTPHDPATLGAAALLLLAVTLGAAYLPARRASRVDPLIALRNE